MELVHRAGSLSGAGHKSVDACRPGEQRLHELSTTLLGIFWTVEGLRGHCRAIAMQ